ncbi:MULTISPECIES: diguanylate cyclase [unclassified Methylomonas]|uniref:diguanylate cyclase n=1 Tax=unclassified Methylomonas TaxID=2608980 RepID=UPI0007C9C61F|nr:MULTISPECIES: diguanylate cyclase [unclassified Methylomonas]ANE58022.1 diguanylate cyclase response regulator [Methylomonas sp. DH-1]WGS88690.1 diguanylate cyclase [Methylomonas sp. UP202]
MGEDFNFHEFKASKHLPSPAGTALTVMQLVQKTDTSVQKLAEVIKADPALTARILSFANSAAFGARRPIANVFDAVQMMGLHAVRNFAVSLSLVGNNRQGACTQFDYGTYWMKSLATAVAIAVLTARERTVAPEEAFTVGILADIGKLALATAWPDIYSKCLAQASGAELLKLEEQYFAINHRRLTLILIQDWGIPEVFVNALKMSFGPPQAEVNRMVRFASQLAFARQIAHYCIADDPYRKVSLPDLQRDAALHNIEKEAFSTFAEDVVCQWHEWGKLIDVQTETRLTFPETESDTSNTLPGLRILLVDDDALLLTRLCKQLTAAGHQVEVCRDGKSALQIVLERKPQLLITDWRMSPMDGLALTKILRDLEIGKMLYVIMLTAATTEDELVEAFDAGIDDYVTKPVNLRILLARIRAGQRIITLQQELEKEKQEIEHYNAELAVANRRLSVIANTDMLTGLPNRRYALSRLQQEWEAVLRHQKSISVMMLDLDHFKMVNDTLGHDAGDVVLTHVANIMKTAVRATDIACRFGGEEFLVIATNTDGQTALSLAERIRQVIQSQQPKDIDLPRPLTVSIGVAGSVGNRPGWQELIKLADAALYEVKAGTRNASSLASY